MINPKKERLCGLAVLRLIEVSTTSTETGHEESPTVSVDLTRTVWISDRQLVSGTMKGVGQVAGLSSSTRARLGRSLDPLHVEVCVPGRAGFDSSADIDACLTQSCHAQATCTDLAAPSTTRTCTCNAGYFGNGTTCTGLVGQQTLFVMNK